MIFMYSSPLVTLVVFSFIAVLVDAQEVIFKTELTDGESPVRGVGVVEVGGFVFALTVEGEARRSWLQKLSLHGDVLERKEIGFQEQDNVQGLTVLDEDVIIVTPLGPVDTSSGIKAIRTSDLSLLWNDETIKLSRNGCNSLVTSDRSIITASGGSTYGIAMTLSNGKSKWQTTGYFTNDCITLSPDESLVYFVHNSGTENYPVVALSTVDGRVVNESGKIRGGGAAFGGPGVSSDGTFVYQFRSNGLFEFNARNLSEYRNMEDREFGSPSNIYSKWNPILSTNNQFIYTAGYLGDPTYCFDVLSTENATIVWQDNVELVQPPILTSDGKILYGVTSNAVLAYDAVLGSALWIVDIGDMFVTQFFLNDAENRLYVACTESSTSAVIYSIWVGNGTAPPSPTPSPVIPTPTPTESPSKSAAAVYLKGGVLLATWSTLLVLL